MKRITKLIFAAFGTALLLALLLPSCDKMDDIQRTFADREEDVYLGKVDSIKSYPGFGKTKMVWYVNADPKIEQTVIYWNLRRDSIVKPFNRTNASGQYDSIVLNNLPEGSLLIEFKNVNSKGETSLWSSSTATIWGPKFADGLRARILESLDYDYSQSAYNLELSSATKGDSVVYSEIEYTTKSNEKTVLRIERSEENITLPNFPDGGTFDFRTIFYPPQGIDTVYSAKKSFSAPKAVFNGGTKVSLKGNTSSRYFDYNGDLGEWNSSGDLIVYSVAANGELTQKERYNAVAPRTTFRELFFYDADRFILVGASNNIVYMYQLANGALTIVKTPAGADALGSGFTMPAFIPARGFFYSSIPATGELRTWIAFNNATWGSPNGSTVTQNTKFSYTINTMLNYETLLGIDGNGYLRSIPVLASGALGSTSRAGMGWSRFTKLFTVGKKLYGLESSGDLYVFSDFNATDNYWIVN